MSRAVLSIGANLGNPMDQLQRATRAFADVLRGVSPVFRTPPWGGVEQADFLNAVLIVEDPAATPERWLARAQDAEQAAGRTRELHWGPRTLDVDVIVVDAVIQADPRLTLPHPYAHQRAFVLVPWLSLDPEAVLPGRGPVAALVAALPEDEVAAVELVAGAELAP